MELRKSISCAARTGLILLCALGSALAQPFQLAQPVLQIASPFFTDSAVIRLRFDLEGAEIRYTLDGNEPTRLSPEYKGAITVRENSLLVAKAFHPDFLASEPVSQLLIKIAPALLPATGELAVPPSPKYPAQGSRSLFDLQKGGSAYSDGKWLGFEGKNLEYSFSLSQKQTARRLTVSTLSAPGAWIFPPRRIEVWAKNKRGGAFKKVADENYPPLPGLLPGHDQLLVVTFPKACTALEWKVVVENYGPLPDWHPGKGAAAWLFVDEIFLSP